MISPEEYPVYNHRERLGIGKDLSGNVLFNCFSIKLLRNGETEYQPFLFSDFIRQYNQYADHSEACASCISRQKVHTYPVGKANVDRAALDRKFSHGEADSATYYSRFADFSGDSKIPFHNFTEHLRHIAAISARDAQKTVVTDRRLMPNNRPSSNLPCGCDLSGRYELIHGPYA
jgi:hypothetical protein